jgi:large subunit ribosomal protein L22
MAKGSGVKTNESPARAAKTGQRGPAGVGVRAEANYLRMSAYKVREVLDQIRGHSVADAADILRFCPRDAAIDIAKVLKSAVANAGHNDDIPAEELYVSACYADEGPTIKRFRPRARGRTGRINKRTAHITVVVSRMPESLLSQARNATAAQAANRARRTAGSRATAEQAVTSARREETGVEEVVAGATMATAAVSDAVVSDAVETSSVQGFVSSSEAETVVETSSEASTSVGDPLNQIIGIGPKLHEELNAAGITTFAQLAALSDSDITALDAKVSRSADQIIEWRTQAQQILDGTWVDTSTKNS